MLHIDGWLLIYQGELMLIIHYIINVQKVHIGNIQDNGLMMVPLMDSFFFKYLMQLTEIIIIRSTTIVLFLVVLLVMEVL